MKVPPAIPPIPGGIEALKGRTDAEAVKAAAREMESLFAYQMIKAMRSASGGPAGGKGLGGDVYGSLFDMELARVLASRGLGLQDVLLRGLDRGKPTGKEEGGPTAGTTPVPREPFLHARKAQEARREEAEEHAFPDPECVGEAAAAPMEDSGEPAASPAEVAGEASAAPAETADVGPGAPPAVEPAPRSLPSLSFPLRNRGRVSSGYGPRKDPFTGGIGFHRGIDIAAPEGTAIYPLKPGTVTFSGWAKGYGHLVVIDHGDGFLTKYAHNRANRVAAGDPVGPDTIIAEVGGTGRATGPHLHFEILDGGKNLRPEAVLAGLAKGNG